MQRLLLLLLAAGLALGASGESVRGKLTATPNGEPALETSAGKLIRLTGDDDTLGVVGDERLHGADLEALGEFEAEDLFRIGPIHKKSMWTWKHGEKHFISFWCEVCAIRTYTPGICMCCQEETALELRTAEESEQ